MNKLVHIGYPKTGTTWFQKYLYPNLTNYKVFTRNKIKNFFLDSYGLSDFLLTNQSAKYDLGENNLVFCEEMLLGSNHSGGNFGMFTKEIAHRLKLAMPEAKIVLFIRNQADIIASSYSQYIKQGGTFSIEKYLYGREELIYHDKIHQFSFEFFQYHFTAKLYIDLFGIDNVKIYLFEDFIQNPKAFINKFLAENELEISTAPITDEIENPRFRKKLLKLGRFLNLFRSGLVLNKYYLMNIPYWNYGATKLLKRMNLWKLMGNTASSDYILGKRNLEIINKYFAASNQILTDQYEIEGLRKHNYPLS